MNENQQQKRDNFIKKLVSNSRSILTNQIAIPLGVQKMEKLISWINSIEPINDIDLSVFKEYYSKTSGLAIGTERLQYNKEFLKKQDKKLDELTTYYKNDIFDKCFEIISQFQNTKSQK